MRVEVKRKSKNGLSQRVFGFYFTDDCIGCKLWLDTYRLQLRVDKKRRFGKAIKFYNRIDNRTGNTTAEEVQRLSDFAEVVQEAKELLKKEIQKVEVRI